MAANNGLAEKSSGSSTKLPIIYEDAFMVGALFWVDPARVSDLPPQLEPLVFANRRCLAGVAFFAYRQTSIGPYNEAGVGIVVLPRGSSRPRSAALDYFRAPDRRRGGIYIYDLPVTTSLADSVGREQWGYPKFVTDIGIRLERRTVALEVLDPAGEDAIVRLRGAAGIGPTLKAPDFVTYSIKDGRVIRTIVDVGARVRLGSGRKLSLEVGRSSHPMAERLRGLGLDGRAPFALQATDSFTARLHGGVPVARA